MFLAIDSSTKNISLAIKKGGKVIVDHNSLKAFGASSLVSVLDNALKKHRIKLKDFKAFIVGAGPGSFTGLRVSYAMAKALAIALHKPIIAVGSFHAIAGSFLKKYNNIVVIADARKGLVYWAKFTNGVMQGKERLSSIDEALSGNSGCFFVTYDDTMREALLAKNPHILLHKENIYPRAKGLFAYGDDFYNHNKFNDLSKLEPLYLHPKDCQVRR